MMAVWGWRVVPAHRMQISLFFGVLLGLLVGYRATRSDPVSEAPPTPPISFHVKHRIGPRYPVTPEVYSFAVYKVTPR